MPFRRTVKSNLRLFEALLRGGTLTSALCSVSRAKKPQRSKNTVFLYVPMETCKSFRDSTALDGTE
jgi:hypothetical protein